MNQTPQRILIDGRFIGVGESMTRYCLEIVRGILALDKDNEYTLLVRPKGVDIACQAFGIPNDKLRISNEMPNFSMSNLTLKIRNLKLKIMDIPHYSLAEQTDLLKYLNSERYDLVHFIQFNHPLRYRGKFVVTVHDLTLLGHLHNQPYYKNLAFGMVMKSAVRNSSKIISVSETSKQEVVEYYQADPGKIAVTYLAVDGGAYNAQVKSKKEKVESFKEKYGIAGEYFLYTGMWKKHKNLLRMLKAFEKVKFEALNPKSETNPNSQISNIQLVLVGKIDKEEADVIDLINQINDRMSKSECRNPNEISNGSNSNAEKLTADTCRLKAVLTTGFVEEEELPLAYAGALAYVIPSLSEGFGLPPLEAMACGTPVLSSNVSAMPEILGEAPLYFDPYDEGDMAKKMQQIVSDEQLRADLSGKGLEQVKKYDWAKTAEQTLEVYREILK